MRRKVMQHHHDNAGHPGRDKTYRAIRQHYVWPELRTNVRHYVQHCSVCSAIKLGVARLAAPLKLRAPTSPWHTASVDLMGPYPKTATRRMHILVVTDTFNKWVEAFPTGEPRAHMLIKLTEENVFNRFGYPKIVLSDNSTKFTSMLWKRACRRWGVTPHYTGIYHPRANPVERRN